MCVCVCVCVWPKSLYCATPPKIAYCDSARLPPWILFNIAHFWARKVGANRAVASRKPVPGPEISYLQIFTAVKLQRRMNAVLAKAWLLNCCRGCAVEVTRNRDSIDTHVNSKRHKERLADYLDKEGTGKQMKKDMRDRFTANPDLKYAGVDEEVHLFRCDFMKALMVSGTPMERCLLSSPLHFTYLILFLIAHLIVMQ